MSAEVASAFVSLIPTFKGGAARISKELNGPAESAGRTTGARAGRAAGTSYAEGFRKSALPGFKKVGILAAAAITGAVGVKTLGFFKDSITAASDLNEASTKTQAIFGNAGKALVDQFAGKGAKALGQTRLDVLNAASTFGTFGKAAGIGGKGLAKFSTDFTGLSTDLASFYNTDPSTAVQAIGAALRGEAEPIRQFGVLLDDATLKQEALSLGLIKTTKKALTPQQRVLAAQAVIWKQTKDAQGDFARTSGGLANQQRILKASFEDTKATIGKALLPTALGFVTFLNKKFLPSLGDIKDAFTFGDEWESHSPMESMAKGARKVYEAFTAGYRIVKVFFKALTSGKSTEGTSLLARISQAGVKVRDVFFKVKDIAGAFLDGLKGDKLRFASDGLNVVATAGLWIRNAAIKAWDTLKRFGGWLKADLWPALQEGARTIMPGLKSAIDILTGGKGGKDGVSGLHLTWKDVGKIITEKVIPFIAKLTNTYLPLWATQIRLTIDAVKALWQSFKNGVSIIAGVVVTVLRAFADLARPVSNILAALSHVPGFEWAGDAAKKLGAAADKADEVARVLENLRNAKPIDIKIKVGGADGKVELPNGVRVAMGTYKARALGGPVTKGQPYIVGEKRPEVFVPNTSGRIVPRVPNGSAGAKTTYDQPIHIHGDVKTTDPLAFEREMAERRRLKALGGRRA